MRTLPNTPSSVWQCIKLCFVMSPQVLRRNWLNFILVILFGLTSQYVVGLKNVWGSLLYLLTVLVGWFVYPALLYKAYHFLNGKLLSYGETYQVVWQRYWRIVGASILFYIASAIALGLPILLILLLLSSVSKFFMLLFIPLGVVYFWLVLSFFYIIPAIVLDNMKILPAFKYSFNLVKGHWWRNFFVFLVYSMLFSIVMGVLFGLVLVASHVVVADQLFRILFAILFSCFMPILMTTFMVVQYNDLKLRLAVKI